MCFLQPYWANIKNVVAYINIHYEAINNKKIQETVLLQ